MLKAIIHATDMLLVQSEGKVELGTLLYSLHALSRVDFSLHT